MYGFNVVYVDDDDKGAFRAVRDGWTWGYTLSRFAIDNHVNDFFAKISRLESISYLLLQKNISTSSKYLLF